MMMISSIVFAILHGLRGISYNYVELQKSGLVLLCIEPVEMQIHNNYLTCIKILTVQCTGVLDPSRFLFLKLCTIFSFFFFSFFAISLCMYVVESKVDIVINIITSCLRPSIALNTSTTRVCFDFSTFFSLDATFQTTHF